MNINLFRYAMVPIKKNVRKGERVLIVSDYKVEKDIQDVLVAAVYAEEAIPTLMVVPPPENFGNELSEMVAKAVLECDLVIGACSTAISHTNTIRAATSSGKRYLAMGGQTTKSFTTGAATADFDRVFSLTQKIANIMKTGDHVHVTSDKGTDIQFSIKNRTVFPLAGLIDESHGNQGGYPTGESATSPLEGTANGVIVVDGSVHQIGKLKNNIKLTVENGRVIKIEGGPEAEELKRILEKGGDENSTNIAEFALGTNHAAKMDDNAQAAKKAVGTIHFALGDNMSLDGKIYSKLHLDHVITGCTVVIDGTVILDKGKLVISED